MTEVVDGAVSIGVALLEPSQVNGIGHDVERWWTRSLGGIAAFLRSATGSEEARSLGRVLQLMAVDGKRAGQRLLPFCEKRGAAYPRQHRNAAA